MNLVNTTNYDGQMTPREIVHELDRHIIGQKLAKRAVAGALRNRWRRMQIDEPFRSEITPKNILMIGPTGVGKTEIARRLAKLANAPFTKVEATKFTEVGYVGKDVESIIRDLVEMSVKMVREQAMERVNFNAEEQAEERILDILLPDVNKEVSDKRKKTRQVFRKKLREGNLNDKVIELDIPAQRVGVEIMTPPGMEEMAGQLQSIFSDMGKKKKESKKLPIGKAFKILVEEESFKLIDEDDIKTKALEMAEQTGIVFIDEVDKIARRTDVSSADVSREGVQRDLLPLIEGCSVNTKYGSVKTDHILFIASGAFHFSKPSDLIPELQGRLPIRVELQALSSEDFERILVEPYASIIEQYKAMLQVEGVTLTFDKTAVRRIAELAYEVNEIMENIGARRLHTMLERIVDDISFDAPDLSDKTINIDSDYVDKALSDVVSDQDLSRYIL